jgi:hypothetical protein
MSDEPSLNFKRLIQLHRSWMDNVKRIFGWDEETARWHCMRINPYGTEIDVVAKYLQDENT